MVLTREWQDYSDYNYRWPSKLYIYRRRISKIGRNFSLLESIRIVQINDNIDVYYDRVVGMSEDKMFSANVYSLIYRFCNMILSKSVKESVVDIRHSKLYKNHPFIGDRFKNVVRDSKLDILGID